VKKREQEKRREVRGTKDWRGEKRMKYSKIIFVRSGTQTHVLVGCGKLYTAKPFCQNYRPIFIEFRLSNT
jgi:hypothetical protein